MSPKNSPPPVGIVDMALVPRWFAIHPEVKPVISETRTTTAEGIWFNKADKSTGMVSWAEAESDVREFDARKLT